MFSILLRTIAFSIAGENCDMVKCELRVANASCELLIFCELRVALIVRVTSCELHLLCEFASCELNERCELETQKCELETQKCELKPNV